MITVGMRVTADPQYLWAIGKNALTRGGVVFVSENIAVVAWDDSRVPTIAMLEDLREAVERPHARFEIVLDTSDGLTIRDIGPWDQFPTVTNDVEWVVDHLVRQNILGEDQRLFYFDSHGSLCEIIHSDGAFVDFGVPHVS